MMILSDEEIEGLMRGRSTLDFGKAVQATILAKLASAELPEPDCLLSTNRYGSSPDAYPVYTADQLRQAYAQGAAAQLDRLEKAEKELSFLNGDLLYWTERAVGKGNANADIEEAWERYEAFQRAAMEASK